MPFVYSIKCKIEPYKEYIGQTAHEDFQVRLNGHMSDAKNGRKRHLYNAIRKYGWDQFTIEILHSFSREGDWQERLDELEIHEIAQRGTLSPGGYNNETGGNRNKVLHEDTKELMSSVRSGELHAMFGKHHQDNEVIKFTKIQQWSFDLTTLIAEYDTIREASEASKTDVRGISRCCKGNGRSAGGFKWKTVV